MGKPRYISGLQKCLSQLGLGGKVLDGYFQLKCSFFWLIGFSYGNMGPPSLLLSIICQTTDWGNDHRFTAAWTPFLGISSFSRSFNYHDKVNWVEKLKEVHTRAWNSWHAHLSVKPQYKLKDKEIQKGGEIPANVLDDLGEAVSSLPPKNKYPRVWSQKKRWLQKLSCRMQCVLTWCLNMLMVLRFFLMCFNLF